MFVRAVWRSKRLIELKQGPGSAEGPSTRDGLGLSASDFKKMTQGLFECRAFIPR